MIPHWMEQLDPVSLFVVVFGCVTAFAILSVETLVWLQRRREKRLAQRARDTYDTDSWGV